MQLLEVPGCPVDGSPGTVKYASVQDAYFGTPGRWHYRQHRQTGHLWLDPRPADPSIGDLYTDYYTHAAEQSDVSAGLWQQAIGLALSARLGYPSPQRAGILARLVSHLPSVGAAAELEVMRIRASESGRMLDVGCGDGGLLRRMRKAGWVVAGIEPDARAARLAEAAGIPVYSSLERLAQKGEPRFDVVVLGHAIEHLPDPVHTLAMLRNLLDTGGRLVLTTPNILSLGSRIFGASWRGLEPPRHFNVFSPDSLRQALHRAGYHVDRMRTEVRMARAIWFLSYLARAGGDQLEIVRPPAHRLLKLAGYAFQLLEAAALSLRPSLGEEIFCVARAAPSSGQSQIGGGS